MAKDEHRLDPWQKPLKEAEERLELEYQRLADIIEATHMGTWERNVQTNEVWANERWAEIVGYTLAELEPMTLAIWKDLVHPDDLKAAESEAVSVYHRKKQFYQVECRLKHKNGHWIWIQARGKVISWTEDDKPIIVSGTVTDITDRKQVEEALIQQSTLLNESQVLANLGSWGWDIVHDTWNFSEQWKKIHGMSANDVPTAKLIEIAHPEDAPYIEKAFTEAKEQRKTYDIEHRIIRADNGEIRYVKALGKVEFDYDTGRPVRMVGSAQDITDRKQAEEELKLAKQEAERANEAKSRYLAHMNHEIRTPLNGFMGFLQLMEDTRLDQQQQYYMKHMKQSTSHLLSIINNVLDYATIEAGQLQLDNRGFNLEEEIETALAPLRSLAQQKSIPLEVVMDKNLPHQMKGDPDRLRQIILNLGGNAVKFTQEGQVKIAISCPETTETHHLLQLVVEDTGLGMTQETLERLYQPFYQVDDGLKPQAKGTGLGMAITRELVDRMDGHIQVDSILGEGTRIKVKLKLNKF